ncbi:protocadherin Fat 2 [Python bivittatus]|uniref:Protocadherin Fat 2 n=1 Tax=Python bivittatus TaxID=176946 RepID=A0A9F5IQ11_PYTBI|nr:protocadherin Fat 2 [Python bivittatus]
MELNTRKLIVNFALCLASFLACEGNSKKGNGSLLHFTYPFYNTTIYENSAPKTYMESYVKMGIYLTDPAWDIKYRIASEDTSGLFKAEEYIVGDFCFLRIRTRSGNADRLNREFKDKYILIIQATEKTFANEAWAKVLVQILDRNDLKPLFSPPSYKVTVQEDIPPKTAIGLVSATDADIGQNAEFYYTLSTRSRLFTIHPTSGIIMTAVRLNATHRGKHQLKVLAVDRMRKISEGNGFGNMASLTIQVEPSAREPPVIASVKQIDSAEDLLYAILSVKTDGSGAGVESVDIVDGDPRGHFRAIRSYMGSNEFMIVSDKEINWSNNPLGFNLSLQAKDKSKPPLLSQTVFLQIPPSKYTSAKFEKGIYQVQLNEFAPPGSHVAMVQITPVLQNAKYTLKLNSDSINFKINPQTGLITTEKQIDFHEQSHFEFEVTASYRHLSTTVIVDIIDCNNHAPSFTQSSYISNFDENLPPGSSVLSVKAIDNDSGENGFIIYHIANQKAVPFVIDPFSGVISTSKLMDYELMQRWYHLHVWASDSGSPFHHQTEVYVSLILNNLNDNAPVFEKINCNGSIPWDLPVGHSVFTVSAIDRDELNPIKYEIKSGNERQFFELNHVSGVISLRAHFRDLHYQSLLPISYALKIIATDGNNSASPACINITVVNQETPFSFQCEETGVLKEVANAIILFADSPSPDHQNDDSSLNTYLINHHTPQFDDTFPRSIDIMETTPVNSTIAQLTAVDSDAGFNGKMVYVISSGNEESCFDIDTETGLLVVFSPLDHERTSFYVLNITVYDLGTPQKSTWKLLAVNVLDANDNAPTFLQSTYLITIPEDIKTGTTIAMLTANDADTSDNGRVKYSFLAHSDKFAINSVTGEVVVSTALDRELGPLYILKVEARDQPQKDHQLFAIADLVISLEDVNDNSPYCIPTLNKMNVPEDLPLGTTLLFLEAFDPDVTSEGELKYSLINDNENMFHLNEFTGALTLEKELDYEKLDFYNLSVKISDAGKPYSLSSLCYIEINVLDINENLHPPSFDSFVYEGSVKENSQEGTPVMRVVAQDADRGKDGQIQYFIREGSGMALFSIENDTGVIFTMGPLDRELCSHYWLTVLAVDQGSVPLSSVAEIYIEISDVNDNPPQMSRPVFYSSVMENSPANTSILQVEAVDPDTDSQGKLTFYIINGNHQGFFAINSVTGLIYTTSQQLDREYKAEHILEVSVSDNGDPALQSSSRAVIQVLDVNDNPPSFSQKLFMVQLPEKAASEAPSPVYRVIAADRDEGLNCQIIYSLEENSEGLFSIHPVTGVVFSQKAFSAQEYNILTVKATDGGTPQLSSSVRLHIGWLPKPLPSSEPLAFDEPHFNFAVMETDPVNHMVGVISVDAGLSQLWFNITGGDDAMNFDIEKSAGSIVIARTLDAKERSNYNLTIEVTDGSSIIKTQAYIRVIDINQHPPQFLEYHYEARIPEDTPAGTEFFSVSATDQDHGKGLIYTLQSSLDPRSLKLFQIDPSRGTLMTASGLDAQSMPLHTLTVMVRDQDVPIKRDFARIVIHIEGCNSHPPQFTSLHYKAEVLDLAPVGTEVVQVRALDPDQGVNAEIHYCFEAGNSGDFFTINKLSGIITVSQKLDQSKQERFTLTVKAEDQGFPQLKDSTTVNIYIKLSDATPPQFTEEEYVVEISESAIIGSPVILVSAISSSFVTYEIKDGDKDGFFSINYQSGLISTQKILDFEQTSSYQLKIRGTNMAGSFMDVPVFVYLIDQNDNVPIFDKPSFVGWINENIPFGSIVMDENNVPLVINATDADQDSNALLIYEILEVEAMTFFKIDRNMGTLTTCADIDYEHNPVFHFGVHVHDSGNPILFASKPVQVTIYIRNINDCPPVFIKSIYDLSVMLPIHDGMELLEVHAEDTDSEVIYSIVEGSLGSAFFIHKTTGVISVLNHTNLGNYHELTIRAGDGVYMASTLVRLYFTESQDSILKFDQDLYLATVKENSTEVQIIIVLGVVGNQLNEPLFYSILNGTEWFRMIQSSGVLQTKNVNFDREIQDVYEIAVEVKDVRNPPRVSQAVVRILVDDVNDNPPHFENLPYYIAIQAGTEPGNTIFKVSATDHDLGNNGVILYSFVEDYKHFWIDPYSGDISLKKTLDFQTLNKYTLNIIARDAGEPPLYAEEEITIMVKNKSNPLFQSLFYTVKVPESIPVYTPILHLQARSPEGLRLIYNIVEKEVLRQFHIDFKTGMLMVTSQLDYESDTKHIFTVRATETAAGSYSEAIVEVHVEDVNDNLPLFSQTVYAVSVSEDVPAQTPVVQLLATDQDSGWNKVISYQILEGHSDTSKFFNIDSNTGEISTTQALDYEINHEFHIKVRATDHGMPPLSSEALVIVSVLDINDNPPKFSQPQYQANVSRMVTCGHVVVKVQALDPDRRDTPRLEYMILSGNEKRHFIIDSTSGIVSTLNHCKKNLESFYSLRVSASDGVFKTTVPVYINITNVNKYSPAFQQDVYEAVLAENAKVGTKVIELLAVDPDDGPYGTIDYTIINKLGQEKFLIDDKGRIETLQKLDRENSTERVIDIKIMAKDGGGKVAFCTVKIILTDENDNPPQFKASEYILSIQSNMSKGSPVIQVLAYDADEGVNADVTYSVDTVEEVIAEDVIEINTVTGVVIIKKSLKGLENRTVKFRVKAEDAKPPHWHSVVPVNLQVVPKEVSLPRFSEPLYTFSASEDLPEGSEIGLVRAVGEEPIIYSLVQGTSAESNEEGIFTLDKQTGALTVQKAMDYEKMKWYQVDVLAHSSHKNTELVSLVSISIHVKDVNDNKPIFEADPYRAFVMENMPAGTPVIQVTADDQDTGSDGQVTYSLGSELSYIREFFTIDSENGWIVTLKELDCEVQKIYKFFVVASDHGKKIQLSSQTLVEVTVTDENDNAPEFTSEIYKGSVAENAEPGQMITILNTIDRDISEKNRQVTCYITEGDVLGQFSVNEVDGKWKVFSKKLLNREDTEKYLLKVMVSDGKFQAATEVEILVLDVNDNSPECKQTLYEGKVSEDASQGFSVLKVLATDADVGSNSQITYSLHGVGAEDFKLDSYTGELTTSTLLDRELKSKYHLVAKATDGGGCFCQMEITVHIEDTNDNAPKFYSSHYAVAIYDNTTIKTPIAVVFAKDPDERLNGEVTYHLAESANGHFSIDEITGVIRLEKPLKESYSLLELNLFAKDRGVPHSLSSFTTVTVSVVDLKEYLPVFLDTEYLVEVKENVAVGMEILNLSSLTRGTVPSTEIKYEVTSGNDLGKFRLHSNTGILYVNGTLDFEVAHEYYLTIEGIRKASTSLSDVTMVVINITDINDHVPEFGQDLYIADISEDAAIGEIVLTVLADDKDGVMNNQITYSIVGGNALGHFMIDSKSGQIYTAKHLDREEISSYSLKIQAMDNGQTALFSDTNVLIHVSDVNDNPPRFFQLNYSVTVQENSPVGTSVLELIMSDRDSPENGPPYFFQIVEGNEGGAFQINQDGVLVTSSILRRRTKEQYLLQVQVVDSGRPPLSSSSFINIHVIQQSQYPPSALPLEIFITTNERTFRGGVLGKIHATDRDPHDTLLYSFVSVVPEKKHFSVGLSDGKIIATDGLQHGHYSLNVSVSDGTFSTITRVQIHVWSFSQDALDKAVMLHFRHLNPEEFISDHWRNLQRFLGSILETKRQNVHMASLQPSSASDGVDLLLAVGEPQYSFYKPSFIASRISQSAEEMDQRVGLRVKKVTYVPCHKADCTIQRACKETFQLDPGTVFTYSTARLSVLTPRHSLEQICSCNGTALRFSGHSYIWYHHQGKRDWQMQFHLQTHQLHAILLTTNGSNSAILQLVNGVPHLGYRCRSGFSANLSSHRFVSDRVWHSVFLEVKSHSIRLLVDDMGNDSLHLPETCSISHSTRDLLIGGLVQHHQPQRITGGFRGCLNAITVDGRNVVVLPKEKQSRGIVEESSIRQCCPHTGACSSNPCLNDGLCSEVQDGGYSCTCSTQFSGDHCEVADGLCEGNPCLHGGTCDLSEKGGYTCHCPEGYWGERCEKVAEKCLKNPCQNSGRCVNSEGSLHCICTDHFQGAFCTQRIAIPTVSPSSGIWRPEEIAKISAGVLGVVILVTAFIIIRKHYCHKVKAHKPVAKEDPDLLSKSEFSKSVGVGTQGLPPIELNILNNGHHNHFSAPDPAKPAVSEFTTFNSSNLQKQRGAIVCSVAPNLPTAAPSSNSDNDSIMKSTWAGEKMVYPGETTYWPPRYQSTDSEEYHQYEVIGTPLPPSPCHRPPPCVDSDPVGLYGGFPFPLDQSNKRAPIPPRYSNQNLEDFSPPGSAELPSSQCQNEYTAVSYYPSQLVESEGPPYHPGNGHKRVSMRLSVAQPSYADCEMRPMPSVRTQPALPPNYEGSDMVESDYGSCEEVMF